ncbi:MAG TPA: DUF3052 domain-containing protein [Acidimicrobiia bacterium]
MAGYSGTPLAEKLGIREGMTVGMLNAPNYFDFDLGDLPADVELLRDSDPEAADIYLIFAARAAEAERGFERAITHLPADGAIWIAWPKKSSGVETDLTENMLRDLFLPSGMVDNKVCAIDETWSGLRFVVRKENRPDWPLSRDRT